MMKKNELAREIDRVANISRTIAVVAKLDLVVGNFYNNRDRAESWTDIDEATDGFIPELEHAITYVFLCDNVPVHAVDYDNAAEVETLNAYAVEAEVVVAATTRMIITDVSDDNDFEQMGYYEVSLEIVI